MQSGGQFVRPVVRHPARNLFIAIFTLAVVAALPAAAQVYMHPPTTTQIGGHFLAPPPSVTSTAGRHTPNALPSVTSIPNYGSKPGAGSYHNGRYGRYGNGYVGGWAYSIPYYYPVDNSAYGYDYVGAGGPDLYSGPPPGPYDPSLHIVAEQPPASPYGPDGPPERQAYAAPPPKPLPDDKPGDPTELVFRNGHHEEVNSYAIMGDAIYVFDQGRKKIALTELDIPATVKANDDRGVQFRLPTPDKKAVMSSPSSSTPKPNTAPSNNSGNPPNVAAMMP